MACGEYDNPVPELTLSPSQGSMNSATGFYPIPPILQLSGILGAADEVVMYKKYIILSLTGCSLIITIYDLNGPVRNAFDAGSINYSGQWEGVGPWKSRFF
jgi:hypothetical protein